MAPLTKDSIETANSGGEATAPQSGNQGKSSSALRGDALSLEVAVKVHGSRVIEVARGTAPQTEPFEEQTVTMIVFPQGAVLRMVTAVNVSQMLVLTNVKTKQDSICRVLKVRPNSTQGSYVEVEFTHRQPGYWGVQFPSEGPAPAKAIAPPQANLESQPRSPLAPPPSAPANGTSSPAAPSPRPAASITATRETKPAPLVPSATFVPTPRPESTFISIGSQEKVQDAASATVTTKPLAPVEPRFENSSVPVARNVSTIDSESAPPPALPSLTMDELLGDDNSAASSAPSVPAASAVQEDASDHSASPASREAFASADSASSDSASSAASVPFGARLDASLETSAARSGGASQNWMLIAACVAVLVAGLGAGMVYFHQHSVSGAQSSRGARTVLGAAQPTGSASNPLPAITPVGQPYMGGSAESNRSARSNSESAPSAAPPAAPAAEVAAPAASSNHPPASAKRAAPGVTSDMVSTALTARPTTSTRGDEGQGDQPPVVSASDAPASHSLALPGISAPNAAALPSPEMRPVGPVKIGGNVKEPKLIKVVTPQYPPTARSLGEQGDVVIETTIDKSGDVVRMHVISGPAILRTAALDALRRWKYEPSILDGEPVEVQMQVTIKFRI